MKRYIYIILGFGFLIAASSCKKFLNVVPVDNLSGNNFWQNSKDAELFTNGLYAMLRNNLAGGTITLSELRSSSIRTTNGTYGAFLANNDLRGLEIVATPANNWSAGQNWRRMTQWKPYYDIITLSNLLYQKLDEIPEGKISQDDYKRYKAEAVFVRSLCYFILVRQFGDVPYFTNSLDTKGLVRTPMVEVLNNCIKDLTDLKMDLPWTYADPTKNGARAMRGGAIALLMHMNMWAAGFDGEAKRQAYYNEVVSLHTEISTSADYSLLTYSIEDNKRIFKGRNRESLFEIVRNANIGEVTAAFGNLSYVLSHYPYLGADTYTTSRGYLDKDYAEKLFPVGAPDLRKDIWFENLYANNNTFQFKKFANVYVENRQVVNDDYLILFRLSDVYLLAAEASAELGDEVSAAGLLNKIRTRAGASQITSSGDELKKQIFQERERELFGEGHRFYDLVRTKRITDPDFCEFPISGSAFNQGAWTWPIDPSALLENPNIKLNDYWR